MIFVQKLFFRPKNIFCAKMIFSAKKYFCAKMIFSAKKYFLCKKDFFGPIFSVKDFFKNVGDPELRGRSTGSMVTDFVLGIACYSIFI